MMVLDGVGLHLSRSFLEEVDEDPHQLLGGKVDEGWLEGGKEGGREVEEESETLGLKKREGGREGGRYR
jgi:hypothetical protein